MFLEHSLKWFSLSYIDFILLTGEKKIRKKGARGRQRVLVSVLGSEHKACVFLSFCGSMQSPYQGQGKSRVFSHPQTTFEGHTVSPLMRNRTPQRQRVLFHSGPGKAGAVSSFPLQSGGKEPPKWVYYL